MKASVEFWDKISKNYDSRNMAKYAGTYNKTVELSKKYLKDTDTVLDYGCGTGITTIELAQDVKKVYAIDTSSEMIKVAQIKAENNGISNIEFDVSDIFNEQFQENSFDVVMAFNILCYLKDLNKMLDQVYKLLKPDGVFISATDCLGDKKTLVTQAQSLLSKVGAIPFISSLKRTELQSKIESASFFIMESHNLYDSPPNIFIAAKKSV